MESLQHKSFTSPDEVRELGHTRVENLTFGSGTVGRMTLQPGWRWSEHVKPNVGTELCMVPHFSYQLSGRLGIRMQDGTEAEIGPDDVGIIPPGHDAWVIGDEPVVLFDWTGTTADYGVAR